MSYVVSQISVVDGTNPKWIVKWPAESTSPTVPPGALESVSSNTGFPYWYIAIPAGDGTPENDPSKQFWNCFYNRVPSWELYGDGLATAVPSIEIGPGNTVGLPEPIRIDVAGNADWTVISSLETTVGNRSGFIKREEFLPSENPEERDESTQSFEYTLHVFLQNNTDPSAVVDITFSFQILGHQYLLYGGIAYFPIVFKYTWVWTDDGGQSAGGFASHFNDVPPGATVFESGITALVRLGKTDFIDGDHPEEHMAFGFPAYEYSTPWASDPSGPPRTTTSTVDTVDLEVDGTLTRADVWIQPDHLATEKYFGFRFDNTDDTTALFDIDNGHRTTADPLPMTMIEQLEPQ